jgi:flagellar assembly factor FliW
MSFLKDNVGKGLVSYAEIKEFDLKIHKVKLIELKDEKRVQLIVVDQKTMFKYKLDVEVALDSNQLF